MNTIIKIFGKGEDSLTNVVLDGEDDFVNRVTITVIKDTTRYDSDPVKHNSETTAITLSNDLAMSLLLALQKYLF